VTEQKRSWVLVLGMRYRAHLQSGGTKEFVFRGQKAAKLLLEVDGVLGTYPSIEAAATGPFVDLQALGLDPPPP
jgi:hypothetical protein